MMSYKVFPCVVVAAVLLAFLTCTRATSDEYRCSYNIHVSKGQIIKAKESISNGARFLKHSTVPNARKCYRLCCELDECDLAQMQYKNDSNGVGVEKVCYMFYCGNPSKCHFGEHDHYATLSYDKPEQKLKDVAEEVQKPAKKVERPKLGGEEERTKPSVGQGCPDGVPVASCYTDPCLLSTCPSNREAICVSSYCGSCHSIFIDSNGAQVDCSGEGYDEETDLQTNPAQHPYQKNTKKPDNWLKDKKPPLDTETEEETTQHSEEKLKSVEPKYHQNIKQPSTTKELDVKTKNMPIKQEIKTKKPDILTKYFEVEKEVPATEENQAEEAKNDQWNKYLGDKDAELEQKLEELTPSSQRPPKFQAKLTTTAEPAIHEWREFVDNNPNFPYTIPKSPKKTTKIPTTKRPTKKPTTEKRTQKSTEKVTTTVYQPKATEKAKTTEAERVVADNDNDGHATGELPPILDHPRPHKNVSDFVVIETRRLRIIENKAVLPLAIFLVLAILLLFVVALRLRIVKSKLKRRPFATDDADYLINGMYL